MKDNWFEIRLMLTHPKYSVLYVSEVLEMEADVFWEVNEKKFTPCMMWGYTSLTTGDRFFFKEIHDVLLWLETKNDFVSDFINTGGAINVIANLPGKMNIGDDLSFQAMELAAKLRIKIGVEVFPNMPEPH